MRRSFLLLAVFAQAVFAADPLATAAQAKLDLIADRKTTPGSVLTFSTQEINAWVLMKLPKAVPTGLRNARIEPGAGVADAYALVDFLKMSQAKGKQVNFLIAKLIEGERPLKVSLRIESAKGRCTVFLTRVELSNIAVSGGALDLLIKTFFTPLYPDAHINEPFDLMDNIDRIEVQPSGVRVVIKK